MQKLADETRNLMNERFGGDNLISLATAVDSTPFVRTVNACYIDGSFYIITHALSGKMDQLRKNPAAAICGDWFTARGAGEDLGWFCRPENAGLAARLRKVFAKWIDNGHNNFDDQNTIILRIRLESGVLFHHGTRYDIDFTD